MDSIYVLGAGDIEAELSASTLADLNRRHVTRGGLSDPISGEFAEGT